MDKEIWEKSKTDTVGLSAFYEARKNNYMWKNRYDVVIISSTKMDYIKKAHKLAKAAVSDDKIKEQLNPKDKVEVMSNAGVFEEGNDALPKNVKLEEGISEIIQDGEHYFVVKVNKVLPSGPKTLEECKGKAINDYQQYLEQNWVGDLKKEFIVKVNQDVFEKVKQQLKK
jgi:peptidyl-prolyl cis-trans isomerase SurA